jgi:hypothetical protein
MLKSFLVVACGPAFGLPMLLFVQEKKNWKRAGLAWNKYVKFTGIIFLPN